MKVGIVVPYSWSFWGAVVEHAELQAEALQALGADVRLLMGNDPPGSFTRTLHPRGRHTPSSSSAHESRPGAITSRACVWPVASG